MSDLQAGMTVKDNDPREPNRVMVIHSLEFDKAVLRLPHVPWSKTCETRVSVARIHTDGKPRRSGWSVVR